MTISETDINSQLEKLIAFPFDPENTSMKDLIAWGNNTIDVLKLVLPLKSLQIQSIEDSYKFLITNKNLFFKNERIKFHQICRGTLESILSDLKDGFLVDLRNEIRIEVEVDFLDQASQLLDSKLKDSAAMIVGAVLEDALRQLCVKCGIPEGKSIESMNAPLKQAGVYNLAYQKQVTAWADIRNNADHARFDEYVLPQVKLMHQGVVDFIVKYLC